MKTDEIFAQIDQLLGQQFNDAPRQLNAIVDIAMRALQQRQYGEARNQLNKAHELANQLDMAEWRAEVAAAWAVYYYHTDDQEQMLKSIRYAVSLEPDNKRIAALKKVLKGQ
jgi:Tfp pilus assembly protein PilF